MRRPGGCGQPGARPSPFGYAPPPGGSAPGAGLQRVRGRAGAAGAAGGEDQEYHQGAGGEEEDGGIGQDPPVGGPVGQLGQAGNLGGQAGLDLPHPLDSGRGRVRPAGQVGAGALARGGLEGGLAQSRGTVDLPGGEGSGVVGHLRRGGQGGELVEERVLAAGEEGQPGPLRLVEPAAGRRLGGPLPLTVGQLLGPREGGGRGHGPYQLGVLAGLGQADLAADGQEPAHDLGVAAEHGGRRDRLVRPGRGIDRCPQGGQAGQLGQAGVEALVEPRVAVGDLDPDSGVAVVRRGRVDRPAGPLEGRPRGGLGGQAPLPLELLHQGGQGTGERRQPAHPLGPGAGLEAAGRAEPGQDQDGQQRHGERDHPRRPARGVLGGLPHLLPGPLHRPAMKQV